MTLRVRDTGALRTATEVRARKTDGTLVSVDRMMIRTADGLTQFYKRGLRLSASPAEANGFGTNRTGPVYTNTVAVSVDGGSPPYSYAWATTAGVSVQYPTMASTGFVGNPSAIAGDIYGTATCTVSDSAGLSQPIAIPVTISRESGA
ncbi:hypothetical protein [uncultured Sphingomonas sp.]|uniref:hypothetical protein n=1 Tax=uncultured Sphingomonas sp. TaxID=158754 RepID=UPI003748B7FD